MTIADGELIASFTAHPDGVSWCGAIYQWHDARGPELVLVCDHRHRVMRDATRCARDDLAWSRSVVKLAKRHRSIAP